MGECRAERDAAAETEHRHARRLAVQQQRKVGEHALCQHVAGIGCVDLAVDGERNGAGQFSHGDGARRSLSIREQVASGQ